MPLRSSHRPLVAIAVSCRGWMCLVAMVAAGPLQAGNPDVVKAINGLVSFWAFGEATGAPRLSHTGEYPLVDGHATKVARVAGGPFSGYSARFDGTSTFLTLPNANLGALNIAGADAQVTVVAWVKRDDADVGFIAGIWQEDNNDPRRQYGLFIDLPTYGGPDNVCGHVSWTGGPSPKFTGSSELLPFSRDYSANRSQVMNGRWHTVAFTYDGTYARSYLDGQFEARPTYTEPGPSTGYGLTYAKNPYVFSDGLGDNGGNFTVGAVKLTSGMRNHFKGDLGGVAVYDRALNPEEIFRLHAAMADAAQPVATFPFRNTGASQSSVSNVMWKAFRNATTDASATTSNGWGIGGTSGVGTELGYLYKNVFNQAGITWTEAVPAIPTTLIDRIEFTLNNSNNTDLVHVAVKVAGQWHVSNQTFAMTANGNGAGDWAQSELKTLFWNRDASAWRLLEFNQSNLLNVQAAPSVPLPSGALEAIGFYQAANSGTLRIDQLQVHVHLDDVAESHKAGWKWKSEYFDHAERLSPTVSGALADPDGDGRVNLMERGMGGSPRLADVSVNQPAVDHSGGRLALVYRAVDPDLDYIPEVSDDLTGTWRFGSDHLDLQPGSSSGEIIAVDRLPMADSSKKFIRLRIVDSGD